MQPATFKEHFCVFCIALTIQMLLLRPNAFLRCGLAHRLCQSLASKAVTGSQQPVVDCLPSHSHDEAVFMMFFLSVICNRMYVCTYIHRPGLHFLQFYLAYHTVRITVICSCCMYTCNCEDVTHKPYQTHIQLI